MFTHNLHITLCVPQTACRSWTWCHVDENTSARVYARFTEHEVLLLFIQYLWTYPTKALGILDVFKLQGRDDLSSVFKEQTLVKVRDFKQEVSKDIVSDGTVAEQISKYFRDVMVKAQGLNEVDDRAVAVVALQFWKGECCWTKTGKAVGLNIRVAMKGCKGEFRVLHHVDFTIKNLLRRQVEATCHRQTAVIRSVPHAVC